MRQDRADYSADFHISYFSFLHPYVYFSNPNHRSVRAATPGNSFPSRSSREAPPPVEIKVIFPAMPNCLTAVTESSPPMMVFALDAARASASSLVPSRNLEFQKLQL